MQIAIPLPLVAGFALALVRASAFVVFSPPFAGPLIPVRVRGGLAVALAIPTAASFQNVADPGNAGQFIIALGTQVFVGLVLSFSIWLLFTAISAAGDIIDSQAGFSLASAIDPLSARQSGPVGRLYQLVGTTLLFSTGAYLVIVKGFIELGPTPWVNSGSIADAIVGASLKFFVAALELSLPIVAVLFLTEVVVGLLGKAAPQLNLFVLGLGAKALIALLALTATIAMLPEATDALVIQGLHTASKAFGM